MSYSSSMPDVGPGSMFAPGGYGLPPRPGLYSSGGRGMASMPSRSGASPGGMQPPPMLSSSFQGSVLSGYAQQPLSGSFSGDTRALSSGLYQSGGSGSRFIPPLEKPGAMPPLYNSTGNPLGGAGGRMPAPLPPRPDLERKFRDGMLLSNEPSRMRAEQAGGMPNETGVIMQFTQDIRMAKQEQQHLQQVNMETEIMASKIADEFRSLRSMMEKKETEYRRVWTTEEVRVKQLSEDSRRKVETIRSSLIGCLEKIDVSNRAMFEVVEGLLALEGGEHLIAGSGVANYGLSTEPQVPSLQQPGSGPPKPSDENFGLEPDQADRDGVIEGF